MPKRQIEDGSIWDGTVAEMGDPFTRHEDMSRPHMSLPEPFADQLANQAFVALIESLSRDDATWFTDRLLFARKTGRLESD